MSDANSKSFDITLPLDGSTWASWVLVVFGEHLLGGSRTPPGKGESQKKTSLTAIGI